MEEENQFDDNVLLQFFRDQMINREWQEPSINQEQSFFKKSSQEKGLNIEIKQKNNKNTENIFPHNEKPIRKSQGVGVFDNMQTMTIRPQAQNMKYSNAHSNHVMSKYKQVISKIEKQNQETTDNLSNPTQASGINNSGHLITNSNQSMQITANSGFNSYFNNTYNDIKSPNIKNSIPRQQDDNSSSDKSTSNDEQGHSIPDKFNKSVPNMQFSNNSPFSQNSTSPLSRHSSLGSSDSSSTEFHGNFNGWPHFNKQNVTESLPLFRPGLSSSATSFPESGHSIISGNDSPISPKSEYSDEFDSLSRIGKDQKIAAAAGISLDVKDMVFLPMDEFNDLLAKHDLTEEQLNLCRDIRRRGKNKVAAQNCRKRKLSQLDDLTVRLEEAGKSKSRVKKNHQRLLSEYKEEIKKLDRLSELVLSHHNKKPNQFVIQVTGEDINIVPKDLMESRSDGSVKQVCSLVPVYLAKSSQSGLGCNWQFGQRNM